MSKIGKKAIIIPEKTIVKIKNNIINISGPRGIEFLKLKNIDVRIQNMLIVINTPNQGIKKLKKYHGLYRSLIQNMIIGVNIGFKKELIIEGVGYRANLEKERIAFSLGFSHVIYKSIPHTLSINMENQNKKIIISGNNKQIVGLYAATIRKLRPPECYLGKGIRYSNEIIIKKQGKSTSK